ncbi:MAG TPA: fructose-bisphosphate aldolase class I [Candidatus Magasanikbacteria bacterium]|nr:MAG: fructose-bisphosphate aldolase [Candidatus Magasanikbacteria bacterium RIFCSPLOWO2_02_FULL_47_16]OGH79810.1 MAG: fructose-bisphosphate aldolase [Candidatus Magasanikbacteria bacterium RIFCSPHIGHO2_02_FULL_48_18]HAZ28324.1 fructose-bisphosphate aldolase class I [Candidatus Magasanikbacteria bacterium]
MDDSLTRIAQMLVAPHKGILAADESTGTIKKRFDSIGVASTEETRQAYRQLLFQAPGMEQYVSGVILYDETIRETTDAGVPFPKFLSEKGVFPGIKVDMGAKPLALFPGETVTEGLDGLRERLQEYKALGAVFAKWRAVIAIDDQKHIPTDFCIEANAHALARYAALCQEAGLVPIVEPEVLMDGTHSIDVCFEVTKKTLQRVFVQLNAHRVQLGGMLLKPNMVISAKNAAIQVGAEEIAQKTLACFRETVPAEIPGIVFLSGGQSERQACETLSEINKQKGGAPWELSFSYGRALQASALVAWGGKSENISAAQEAFLAQACAVGAAREGAYVAIGS